MSDWAKMLFNAKTQAEEAYREQAKNYFEWKPVIYESQIANMAGFYSDPEKWKPIDEWLRRQWEVIDDRPRIEAARESWAQIHKMLDDEMYKRINLHHIAPRGHGKTWLGSQIEQQWIDEPFDYTYRYEYGALQKVREVPNVRDLSWSYGPVNTDWKDGTPTFDHGSAHWSRNEESDAVQLEEWLHSRSICRRASSCGMA